MLPGRSPRQHAGGKGGPAEAAREHWAFRPVRAPQLPAVKDRAWPATSIDRFILARLESKGLSPSPPADRRTLIRRATFDLTGLPPTPEEVAAFEADPSPDAYARLIDRLLASPHYGERWARHWLDVARYSDTRGYVFFQDADYHWAYTYRDYVIRSFNGDLPFDRFLVEQIAADRLPLGDDKRPLTALGFLTLGGRFMNNFHDVIDDRIDVVSRGLLGLTMTCARCHDHKFDPISQKDYYALYGVFASSEEPTIPPTFAPPPRTDVYEKFARELQARAGEARRVRRGQARGARRRLADPGRRVPPGRAAGPRPAQHRRLHADRRRHRPEPEDVAAVADVPGPNPQDARSRLRPLACPRGPARRRLRGPGEGPLCRARESL